MTRRERGPAGPLEGPPAAPPAIPEVEWRRLDPRMLLVHPVVELVKFLPLLVGIFFLGSSSNGAWWQLIGVAIPVALGIMRYVTTSYRITPTQVELQRGLIGRKVLTTRLDRVRAVELTSTLAHRALGLAKVEIGTGSSASQGEDAFTLDGLPLEEARRLRVSLLHRGEPAQHVAPATDGEAGPEATPVRSEDDVLLSLDPRWVRFAPLTSSGSVIAAGVLAVLAQFGEGVEIDFADPRQSGGLVGALLDASPFLVAGLAVLAFLVLGAVFSVLGYLVVNWGFTLSRDVRGRSFHVRRGLFTSTETSLERERVRGLEVHEPLGLRAVGAAKLAAIVTGVSRSDSGTTPLVPPAPRSVIDGTGAAVLETREPLVCALERHGPAARRRRLVRALTPALVLPVAVVALVVVLDLAWWWVLPSLLPLPAAAWLGLDRYRRLGHALDRDHLVLRSGSLAGRRVALQRTGIIGWNVHQSWFQRRAGLATLVATTAAGSQAYAVVDVAESHAVALADEAVPGLLTPFLA